MNISYKVCGFILIVCGVLSLVGLLVTGIIGIQDLPLVFDHIGLRDLFLGSISAISFICGVLCLTKRPNTDILIKKVDSIPLLIVSLFFGVYFFIGLVIAKDYGISTDEITQYQMGKLNYEIMRGVTKETYACSIDNTCYYPPLFEVILYRLAPGGDSSNIYIRRHQITFAFFAFSVFIFFLLGRKVFKDWKIGLLGSLFLIISPRIFASSFYNSKDIPFLSAYIIAMYTMVLALDKKDVRTIILHGIATGIACSIRTPGLIIIPITIFFWFFDLIFSRANWKKYLKSGFILTCYILVTAFLIYISFPFLYTNPIRNFIESFNIMRQFPWNNIQFFMGHNIGNHTPWFYSMVWFSISSPFFYLLLFALGMALLVIETLQIKNFGQILEKRNLYIAGACGFLPIIMVVMMKSVLYNENRQMFFCYPALLLISLFGFKFLVDKLKDKFPQWQLWVTLSLIAGLAYPVYFMSFYHPYQNVYFNFLAGTKMSIVKERYSLDTWGLSVKQGLEYILETDSNAQIPIAFYEASQFEKFKKLDNAISIFILPRDQRARLIVTNYPRYVICTYHNYPLEKPEVPGGQVYYSIRVGDADILTIYKIGG